jgi:hypothetical protein
MIWMECLESHICSGYRLCFCFYKCPICSEDAVYFFLILCTSSEVFIPRHNKQVRWNGIQNGKAKIYLKKSRDNMSYMEFFMRLRRWRNVFRKYHSLSGTLRNEDRRRWKIFTTHVYFLKDISHFYSKI